MTEDAGFDESAAIEVPVCPSCGLALTPGEPTFDGCHPGCALVDTVSRLREISDALAGANFDDRGFRDLSLGQLILWWERAQEESKR